MPTRWFNHKDKKSCRRKKSYFTEREAKLVANKLNINYYECPVCFCWHLTSKNSPHEKKK